MDIHELADNLKSKEDFIVFLQEFQRDFRDNHDKWENPELGRYLEAMEAFMSGSTGKSMVRVDFTPSWSLFAYIMIAASIYE